MAHATPTIPCTALPVGKSALVARIDIPESGIASRLAALGVAPGTSLTVLQRWPGWVLRAGETELALEESVAETIHVGVDPGPERPQPDKDRVTGDEKTRRRVAAA